MAAAEVHPLHPPDRVSELLFHSRQRAGKRIGIQFTQRMKMQARNALQILRLKLIGGNPQPGAGGARIINLCLDFRSTVLILSLSSHVHIFAGKAVRQQKPQPFEYPLLQLLER